MATLIGYNYSFPRFNKVSKYFLEENGDEIILTKTDMSDNLIEQWKGIETKDDPIAQNITSENLNITQILNGSMIPSGFYFGVENPQDLDKLTEGVREWFNNNVAQVLYEISYYALIRFDSGGNPLKIIYLINYIAGAVVTPEWAENADEITLLDFMKKVEEKTGREFAKYIFSHYDNSKNYQFFVDILDRTLGIVLFDYL